MSCLELS